jgi:hypothetical protein
MIRDPRDPSKTTVAAIFQVPIVKSRRAVRRNKDATMYVFHFSSSLTYAFLHTLSFTVFLDPSLLFCLASLAIARAIQDNAFEIGVDSVKDLLHRPDLGKVDYIPLYWKATSSTHLTQVIVKVNSFVLRVP